MELTLIVPAVTNGSCFNWLKVGVFLWVSQIFTQYHSSDGVHLLLFTADDSYKICMRAICRSFFVSGSYGL